jgi:hypothetical protein
MDFPVAGIEPAQRFASKTEPEQRLIVQRYFVIGSRLVLKPKTIHHFHPASGAFEK